MTKSTVGRVLLLFAIATGFISFWYTLAFTWTPEFQATALDIGPTHSNYHAFREAMLAFGVNALLVWTLVRGSAIKMDVWYVTLFMAFLYYLGWWLPWPIWGFHAPYLAAEINHAVATVGGLAGLWLVRPQQAFS